MTYKMNYQEELKLMYTERKKIF